MTLDLVLHLRADGPLNWSLIDRARNQRLAQGDASGSPSELDAVSRTLVLLPAETVFLSRVSLATGSEREARRAAPFLIEDNLAAPVEATRVAVGPSDDSNQRWVLAAEQSVRAKWVEQVSPWLRGVVRTLPESLLLSVEGKSLVVSHDRGRILYRLASDQLPAGSCLGGAIEPDWRDTLLPGLLKLGGEGPIGISPALGLAGQHLKALRDPEFDRAASAISGDDFAAYPDLLELGGSNGSALTDWLRPFARAASIALVLAGLAGGLMLGESVYLRDQAERYDQASVEMVRTAVPAISGPLDPVRAERILATRLAAGAQSSAAPVFLSHLSALSALTAEHPDIHIDTVRFDITRRQLDVSARYARFADFDALVERADTLGLEIEDQGGRETGGFIAGEFVLRMP